MASDDRNPEQGTETNTDDASKVDSTNPSAEATAAEADTPERKAPASETGSSSAAPAARTGKGGTGFLVILLLLVLAGMGAGGWWAWQQWTLQISDWEEQRADLQGRVSSLNNQVDQLRQAQSGETDAVAALEQSQSDLREDLSGLAAQINREIRLQETDVQRLEVEYLLRTARHVSLLNRDVAQAERLLTQADQRLAEFDDLAYLPVREALAADIQRLRELPRPDVDGLYFELGALIDRADDWQWWPDTSDWQAEAPAPTEPPDAASWYMAAWQELRGLIEVRYRNDAEAARRLPPEVFNAARVRFQLALQQAQVALVQRNQALYSAGLEHAAELVRLVGDQAPQSGAVLDQLSRLQNATINPELPRIDRGLNALQALAESPDGASRNGNTGEDGE